MTRRPHWPKKKRRKNVIFRAICSEKKISATIFRRKLKKIEKKSAKKLEK
jgi:hypothetical protein